MLREPARACAARARERDEELQSTIEELETTNEELQSTNEELETTNEELQSTNEELETMNEELQSTNEELETMNDELRDRGGRDAALERVPHVGARQRPAGGRRRGPRAAHCRLELHATELLGLRDDEVEGEHLLNLDVGLPVATLREPVRRVLAGARGETVTTEGHNRRGQPVTYTIGFGPLDGGGADIPVGAILLLTAERRGSTGLAGRDAVVACRPVRPGRRAEGFLAQVLPVVPTIVVEGAASGAGSSSRPDAATRELLHPWLR